MRLRPTLFVALAAMGALTILSIPGATGASAQTVSPATSAPVITTTAGTGKAGFNGDGGPAIQAKLNSPAGVAEDGAGDLFIADTANFRVREVSTAGTIATVAGNGTGGFSGDGGPAIKAKLASPVSPAVDGSGDLFIADAGNNRIREVTPNGIINTVAGTGKCGSKGDGGPATTAMLCDPTAVALAPGGGYYVADAGNNKVRLVSAAGVISTFAGTGTTGASGDGGPAIKAMLSLPTGLAVDSLHNVYIVDTGNNKVRSVSSAGVISTFAGSGKAGFSGDGGKAVSAQLNHPLGIGVDPLGNLYIADTANYRIRVVIPKGDIFTYAGTGMAGYSGDGGPAVNARIQAVTGDLAVDSNDVFFADTQNQRVRRVQGGPPPNIAESPLALVLPLSALALLLGVSVTMLRQRRAAAAGA